MSPIRVFVPRSSNRRPLLGALAVAAVLATAAIPAVSLADVANPPTPATVAGQPPSLTLEQVWTDNYKPAFNGTPNVPDTRTCMIFKEMAVGGVSYLPAAAAMQSEPVTPGQPSVEPSLVMQGSNGTTATLTVSTTTSSIEKFPPEFRIDYKKGEWCTLSGFLSRHTIKTANPPGNFTLTLTAADGKTVLGTRSAVYRYDRTLYNATAKSIEHNGPGGRWYVDGTIRTETDLERTARLDAIAARAKAKAKAKKK